MEKQPGTYRENLHVSDYTSVFAEKQSKSGHLISDYYRPKESLNGTWRFGIDQYDTSLRAKWYEEKYTDEDGRPYPVDFSFDTWETITVPSCWNMHSERLFLYEGSIVYTRTFTYENHGEKRVFLKFGGASYEAYVFINKKFAGMHIGASTPFYIEATDSLEQHNRIVVVVNNTRRRTNVPCENTDWFNYGGLYRDVEMLRLPETFIQDFTLRLGDDMDSLHISVRVSGADTNGTAVFYIDELGLRIDVPITNGSGQATVKSSPELWSPQNPKLYSVSVAFGEDRLDDKVGFRDIKVVGRDIFLNGSKLLLKGVSIHEESVANGKSVTEEEIRENYRFAKEMNCNYVRLAHYPHSEKAARIADEVGILLWEEVPVYWAIEFENKTVYDNAENQLLELITRDKNRASVIIWSVGNENADTDARLAFMSALVNAARTLDPTRLISAACLVNSETLMIADRLTEHVDIIGINEYYGWYEPDFSKLLLLFENSRPEKPVIISEFGADARAGQRGTRDDLFTEDHQLAVYERQIATLRRIPYVKGISPWILFEFRCPRRVHTMQNYYNLKGLLSADKKHKKLAFGAMKDFYADWCE